MKHEEWTNFNGREDSCVVYEYDRLTEDTCDIIAECKTVEVANFIANAPEQIRSQQTLIDQQAQEIERQMERKYVRMRERDAYKDSLELAVKRLKEIAELRVDSDISAGIIARNTISEINILTGGIAR